MGCSGSKGASAHERFIRSAVPMPRVAGEWDLVDDRHVRARARQLAQLLACLPAHTVAVPVGVQLAKAVQVIARQVEKGAEEDAPDASMRLSEGYVLCLRRPQDLEQQLAKAGARTSGAGAASAQSAASDVQEVDLEGDTPGGEPGGDGSDGGAAQRPVRLNDYIVVRDVAGEARFLSHFADRVASAKYRRRRARGERDEAQLEDDLSDDSGDVSDDGRLSDAGNVVEYAKQRAAAEAARKDDPWRGFGQAGLHRTRVAALAFAHFGMLKVSGLKIKCFVDIELINRRLLFPMSKAHVAIIGRLFNKLDKFALGLVRCARRCCRRRRCCRC